ncbi:hypothetical protein [Vibrio sp. Isolate30]|uniref:hypothetical protein n=1 Tax=Vibrio sp. Isolate30 TaxID=2908536 RepID=UPI001EFE527A|nr:hypothetical protein [Vibrio sp. Isolate30]MCG9630154.1 hypothetical protein [Vibrio sp. Isolate30]
MGIKKRINVSKDTPKTRHKRRKVDYAEVYDDIRQGYRPCDIARHHDITRQHVYVIRDKMQALESVTNV